MKKLFAFVMAMLMLVGVSGCKRDHESVIKDTVSCMKQLASVLKDVKDEASAKSAVSKIEGIAKEMKTLQEEAKKMGEPSKEVNAELEKKFKSDMEKVTKDLDTEMMRIMKDEKMATIIMKAISEIKSL